MRGRYAVAVLAVALALFATKLVFFSAPSAEATPKGMGLDVSKMHENLNLPVQEMHDMSFVF